MDVDSELRAYDSLSNLSRVADLSAIARAVLCGAASARRLPMDRERLGVLVSELHLSRDEAITPFGNALDVLDRGPEDEGERALASALAARALGTPANGSDPTSDAAEMLWLAAHTAFDATGLVDVALGANASAIWDAVSDQIRQVDRGTLPATRRGEALAGALALGASRLPNASAHAATLAAEVRDPKLVRALRGSANAGMGVTIAGELTPPPLSAALTIVSAAAGVLLATRLARATAKVVLAYKMPAEVVRSEDGGVRVRWRVEVLGRVIREHDVVLPRAGILRVVREVRYPRAGMYSGLLALAIGSYVGVGTCADGLRAASPSLLGWGLLVCAVGLALDFALGSLVTGARGRCRVLFVPRAGATLCLTVSDLSRADAFVAGLVQP
ncbi:MAG: hypothetical protein M3O50_12000 [Myxococcota bacterium]|nr:hypothetical protein [Myxococcota bacterium]